MCPTCCAAALSVRMLVPRPSSGAAAAASAFARLALPVTAAYRCQAPTSATQLPASADENAVK